MKHLWLIALVLLATGTCLSQRCDSIAAASYGGWKSVSTAPRDGTIIEMMETYGVAPWYARFYWRKKGTHVEETIPFIYVDKSGKQTTKVEKISYAENNPRWIDADDAQSGVTEDECLFWRPYKGTGKYVDPTGGAQKSVAYWCAAVHRPYDAKTDSCK
jgi:hypothetical protein